MKKAILMLPVAKACFGQQQTPAVQDLDQLIGKEVIAQRMPRCQPGTFKIVTTYAGQHAKVISLKPSNAAHVSAANMSRLTPELRAFLEDTQKAATVLVQFADSTQLDSCGPVSPNRLSSYFGLAPGEIPPIVESALIVPSAVVPTVATAPAEVNVAPVAPVISKVEKPKSLQSASTLSDEEVSQAIKGFGGAHWVIIRDMGLMDAQGNQQPSISLDAVRRVRAGTRNGEFFVAVFSGGVNTKIYKIKSRHQSKLGL